MEYRRFPVVLRLCAVLGAVQPAYADEALDTGGACEPEPTQTVAAPSAAAAARLILADQQLSSQTLDAIRTYVTHVCDYNAGRRQCLGTAEGFAGSLLRTLGATAREGAARRREGALKFSEIPIDRTLQGRQILDLDDADALPLLRPGQMIHTKCHCSVEGNDGYSPASDAHHWAVFVGTAGGEPRFFDNTRRSLYKGCDQCKKLAGGRCGKLQKCLDRCRADHRRRGTPAGEFCDPDSPETCLMTLADYDSVMRHWDNRQTYCDLDRRGRRKMPCIYGIHDPSLVIE